jgi:hypothetical protein
MSARIRAAILSSLLLLPVAGTAAKAETFIEQAAEHRFQLDFHVADAALKRMLPQGWEPAVATAGLAKDANLRMIFIDRLDVVGMDGKPLGQGSTQMVYLAVPVKQPNGAITGQMIIAGLTKDSADAPGAFGVYRRAGTAKMTRSITVSGGAPLVDEDWDFSAGDGEHMQVHVKYERAAATKGGGEVKFFNPADPSKYQIFKTEQGIDITRNATTNPPDRVKEFTYHAGGGRIAALFDGTEKVLSWDSFPWYNRTVLAP